MTSEKGKNLVPSSDEGMDSNPPLDVQESPIYNWKELNRVTASSSPDEVQALVDEQIARVRQEHLKAVDELISRYPFERVVSALREGRVLTEIYSMRDLLQLPFVEDRTHDLDQQVATERSGDDMFPFLLGYGQAVPVFIDDTRQKIEAFSWVDSRVVGWKINSDGEIVLTPKFVTTGGIELGRRRAG